MIQWKLVLDCSTSKDHSMCKYLLIHVQEHYHITIEVTDEDTVLVKNNWNYTHVWHIHDIISTAHVSIYSTIDSFQSDVADKEAVVVDQEDGEDNDDILADIEAVTTLFGSEKELEKAMADEEAVVIDQEDEEDKDGVLADIEAVTTLFDSTKELEKAKAMDENVAQSHAVGMLGTLFTVGKFIAKRYLKKKVLQKQWVQARRRARGRN